MAEFGPDGTTADGAPRVTVPGVDVPDRRGRTGLDQAGRDLTRNPDVRVRDVELLASGWHVLRRTTFEYRHADGRWTTRAARDLRPRQRRDDPALRRRAAHVLLTRQFRYPAYVNGHPDGMLIEAAAGLLDDDDPETAIRREAVEELGVEVGEIEHVFDVYMSPGSVTERDALLRRAVHRGQPHRRRRRPGRRRRGHRGRSSSAFDEALAMIGDGRIADAKTIMLLQWAALRGPFRPGPSRAAGA